MAASAKVQTGTLTCGTGRAKNGRVHASSKGDVVRLLIVEDEIRLASALQRGLGAEGFTVDVAHTGPDGLHMAQENTYDAVILDIMLPDLSGYRIIEQLRAGENWVPILMLTAK